MNLNGTMQSNHRPWLSAGAYLASHWHRQVLPSKSNTRGPSDMSSSFYKSVSEAPNDGLMQHSHRHLRQQSQPPAQLPVGGYNTHVIDQRLAHFSADSRVVSVTAIDRHYSSSYSYTTLRLTAVVSYKTASLLTSTSQYIAPSA